jgi:multicomponent Na+:H+ antiporter subunit B
MFQADSLIFRLAYRLVFVFSMLFAVYLFFRGHNQPGGGFIGGLASALALAVLSFDIGVNGVKRLFRIQPLTLALIGLLTSIFSAVIGPATGGSFMQHFNGHINLPFFGELHIGTPLIFDLGVALVVIGVFLRLLFSLSESAQGAGGLTPKEQEELPEGEYEVIKP